MIGSLSKSSSRKSLKETKEARRRRKKKKKKKKKKDDEEDTKKEIRMPLDEKNDLMDTLLSKHSDVDPEIEIIKDPFMLDVDMI